MTLSFKSLSMAQRLIVATSSIALGLAAAGGYMVLTAKPVAPTLNEALFVTPSNLTLRLFPADIDAKTLKPIWAEQSQKDTYFDGKHTGSFIVYKDGTSQDIFFQSDGEKRSYMKDFYPKIAGDSGRRQRSLITYTADGVTPRSEEWYRLNGTREKVSHLLQDGTYQSFNLFEDGITAASETITAPNPYATGFVPKLLKEQKWRPLSEGHSVASLNVLNDDGTRELSDFDELGRLLRVQHGGLYGTVGTTIRGFYPTTGSLRMESKTDYQKTEANYYTESGVLSRKLDLTSFSVTATFYDKSGKVPLYKQTFWIRSKLQDGKSSDFYVLWQIDELRPDGTIAHSLTFDGDNRMNQETFFGDTINGITYERRQLYYRQDGTLEKEEVYNTNTFEYKTTMHDASENIRADYPAIERAMFDMTDPLPVPPPERMEGH